MSATDEPFDAGDRQSVKARGRNLKREALSEAAVIRTMLATPEQRKFWWHILEVCGIFRAELLSPEALLFATGQRNIGLLLLGAIPPDLFRLMSDEASKEKQDA